jgi:hypothetical protein
MTKLLVVSKIVVVSHYTFVWYTKSTCTLYVILVVATALPDQNRPKRTGVAVFIIVVWLEKVTDDFLAEHTYACDTTYHC